MKKKMMFAALGAMLLLGATNAYAEDEDVCASDCPSDQKKVGFADGNKATCLCVDPGEGMTETVVEPADAPAPDDGGSAGQEES